MEDRYRSGGAEGAGSGRGPHTGSGLAARPGQALATSAGTVTRVREEHSVQYEVLDGTSGVLIGPPDTAVITRESKFNGFLDREDALRMHSQGHNSTGAQADFGRWSAAFNHTGGATGGMAMQGSQQALAARTTGSNRAMQAGAGRGAPSLNNGFGTLSFGGGSSSSGFGAMERGDLMGLAGSSGGGMAGLLARESQNRKRHLVPVASGGHHQRVRLQLMASATQRSARSDNFPPPPMSLTNRKHLDRSRTLCIANVKESPVITVDKMQNMLSASPAPVPRVERYYWPHPNKPAHRHAWVEFPSADARRRAHEILFGRPRGTSFLLTYFPLSDQRPAPAAPGLQPSAAPPRPTLRADLDSQMSNAERLANACREAGVEPFKRTYGLRHILITLGFRMHRVKADGHCLFKSFCVVAGMMGLNMSVSDAREIGAKAWDLFPLDDAASVILGTFARDEADDAPTGDEAADASDDKKDEMEAEEEEVETADVWPWLKENLGDKITDPAMLVEAFKTGLSTEAFFYGGEAEMNVLAKHVGVNVLLINDTLKEGDWPFTFPSYPDPSDQPNTVIFKVRFYNHTPIKHYDVVSFKDQYIFDTTNLPAALKTLHCIQ